MSTYIRYEINIYIPGGQARLTEVSTAWIDEIWEGIGKDWPWDPTNEPTFSIINHRVAGEPETSDTCVHVCVYGEESDCARDDIDRHREAVASVRARWPTATVATSWLDLASLEWDASFDTADGDV